MTKRSDDQVKTCHQKYQEELWAELVGVALGEQDDAGEEAGQRSAMISHSNLWISSINSFQSLDLFQKLH